MPARIDRIFVLQLCLLAVLAVPAVTVAVYLWDKHRWAEQKLSELAPRYARLEGLMQAQADIDALRQSASQTISRFAYPAGRSVSEVGTEAQQTIRAIMADARLDVQSIQVQPVREGKVFDRVPVALRLEGEMVSLQAALSRLVAVSPAVLVDSMTLSLVGPARPASAPRLVVQLNLSVLKERAR